MESKKGKKIHLSKDALFEIIKQYLGTDDINTCLKSEEVKNPVSHQTRYYFENSDNGIKFELDVYYRSDNTLTLAPVGNPVSLEHGINLIEIVDERLEFKDVTSKTFTCLIGVNDFKTMISYLEQIDGVKCVVNEDKGVNGHIYSFLNDFGDKIHLTYWSSSTKLMFQGLVMRLYAEIECFLTTLSVKTVATSTQDVSTNADDLVKAQFPSTYSVMHYIIKELLQDSFSLLLQNPNVRDFSVFSFPALKALEGRMKEIFGFHGLGVDKQFSIGGKALFKPDPSGKYVLDASLTSIRDAKTIDVLGECYDYYHKYRHSLFHTRQSLVTSTLIISPSFAEQIIYDVCRLINESYIVIGK